MITDKGAYDQVERFVGTKVFHENIARAELPRKLAELLREFRHLTGSDDFWTYDFRISKKGKLLGGRKRRGDFSNPETSAYPSASFVSVKQSDLVSGSAHRQDASRHNRVKNYILEQGDTVIPALRDLGVITAEGKVVAQMYDKYRQINRYVEVVDHEVRKFAVQYPIGGDRCFRVIDFGSGKLYLTFILYHYLTEIKKMQVEMIGLDLKEDVVTHCNEVATRYGYRHLHFECCDVANYRPEGGIDMVMTLHACDTATDYALYHAIRWNAKLIYSVPCCQHELHAQMKPEAFGILSRYGVVKERVAALLTDAVRGNLLVSQGYKVQMLEFVDMENSPKNILIKAVRTFVSAERRKEAVVEIEKLLSELGAGQTLYALLERGQGEDKD